MGTERKDHGIGGTVISDKVRSQITEVIITDRTYDKEKFDPTLINFFFGKNGTGKSTVAAYLHDSPATSFTWDPAADPEIKREIFNEEYITQNVQSYGNIPGVFTISESDAKAQKELDDKNAEKRDVDDKLVKGRKAADDALSAISTDDTAYVKHIWDLTEQYRKPYGDALSFLNNKKKLLSSWKGSRRKNSLPKRSTRSSILFMAARRTKSAETLMNVCRQILEYYFIQMCGYKNGNLRVELLDKNEKDFIRTREDGTIDRSRYNIASAMIALLNVGATGFNDGLYFDSSAADIDQMRYVFRRLFEIKHQEQHYKMMMQEE